MRVVQRALLMIAQFLPVIFRFLALADLMRLAAAPSAHILRPVQCVRNVHTPRQPCNTRCPFDACQYTQEICRRKGRHRRVSRGH